MIAVLKCDERSCEDAIKRVLSVRACRLHDDIWQVALLRFDCPVPAVAGVQEENKTVAIEARGTGLRTNVISAAATPSASAAGKQTCHTSTTCSNETRE
jgi:hypothetical protein